MSNIQATSTQSSAALNEMEVALGPCGEFPVPFAVFRLTVDTEAGIATDAHYVYASKRYCLLISRDIEGVVGRSYLEIGEGDKDEWLAQCYRAAVDGEFVRGFIYDPLVRDWTCYNLAPSHAEGCCVYSLIRVAIDEQQRKQLMSSADARTSLFISEMLNALAAEQQYEPAMNGMLQMMSTVIHADRIAVFECGDHEATVSFELCADGVSPQLGSVFPVPKEMLRFWFRNAAKNRVMLVPNVSIIEKFSKPLYNWCRNSGTNSLMAAPFFNDGEIVGFLGAYNYRIDSTIDLNRLFDAVATFIGARIENRQLIESLKRASSHDVLTGLLNRRGSQVEIGKLLADDPTAERVLVLIDIDDFKRINDVFGHDAGDEALRAMTRTLKRAFPEDAILSRNGGDEFLVVLSGNAAKNVRDLLTALSEQGVEFTYANNHHHLTLSMGYAHYPRQANNMRELFSKADDALYAVKLAGKASFREYTAEADVQQRLQLGFSTRDVLNSIPYPLLVCRANSKAEILFASAELAKLLGYANEFELMQDTKRSVANIIHPNDHARVASLFDEYDNRVEHDEMLSFRFDAITKDGQSVNLLAQCKFVEVEETGQVLYTLFSA